MRNIPNYALVALLVAVATAGAYSAGYSTGAHTVGDTEIEESEAWVGCYFEYDSQFCFTSGDVTVESLGDNASSASSSTGGTHSGVINLSSLPSSYDNESEK